MRITWLLLWIAILLPSSVTGERTSTEAMRFGVGDRLTLQKKGDWVGLAGEARRLGAPTDYLQLWLTRGWQRSWVPDEELQRLVDAGTTPVLVHYFFGDEMSRERLLEKREEWHASLRRLGQLARSVSPVMIVLEPEFNNDPPAGETHSVAWNGFAKELRRAIKIVRDEAPNAQIGICAGDFFPTFDLEKIRPVANSVDFMAFQEMRAITDAERERSGYLRVGWDAVRYARYLRREFGKPILLAYAAISSHGGWEEEQAQAIRDIHDAKSALAEQGVFGVIYFQLFDDPDHVGYFGDAEASFGLVTHGGRPKPAFWAFKELAGKRGARAAAAR